ncbi:MAG: hypothetical protein ACK5NB_12465 [Flavobacteriaceae bacterium]
MKKLILIFLISIYFNGFSQESNFYKLDGTILASGEGKSINNIHQEYFSDVEMIKVYHDTDNNKECNGYDIIYKKYTQTPLFILGAFPKEKHLKKCIDKSKFNVVSDYSGYSFKSDLDNMIENQKSKEYVVSIFGNPQRETIDKEKGSEIVIYNYNKYYGTVKFDLVFVNNTLNRYILTN